jgi:hypothetical protein
VTAPVRSWPETLPELTAQVRVAEDKYRPLVGRLGPGELIGLSNVVAAELAVLKAEARAEEIRRGARPPGTRIGR